MIKVLAVDDEPLALQQLVTYISKVPFLELAGSCTSARKALDILATQSVQAIFLDISMPGMSGIELAKGLAAGNSSCMPFIIFTTAYQEFAVDGFRVDALDYLLKPFSMDEFMQSAQRLKSRIELLEKAGQSSAQSVDDTLFFKSGYKIVRIKAADIFYTQSMGEYMKLYTKASGRLSATLVLHTMSSMLSTLPTGRFMRIHRSYIINLSKLEGVQGKNVLLTDGSLIPIGDNYKQDLKEWLSHRVSE